MLVETGSQSSVPALLKALDELNVDANSLAGVAVGVRLPDSGVLRPATPPPDFDLHQALTSLQKFAARSPSGIALAHYGLVPNPETILDEAAERLTRWAEVAEQAWKEGRDITAALEA